MDRFAEIMYLLYSVIFTLGILFYLPSLLWRSLRRGKEMGDWRERLGCLSPVRGGPVIWVHCVSVGETRAAQPLIRALRQRYPDHAIVISTITPTGQRLARALFQKEAAAVFYFPFDWAFSVRRALRTIAPRLVIIMETELWPRFLRECRRRGIPTALVNGRLSGRSFKRYMRARFLFRRVANDLALAIMQTESDAARIRAIGLPRARVRVSGNLKFDLESHGDASPLAQELDSRFALSATDLIIAASTHDPEERIALEAFKMVRQQMRRLRLILAPRHPERGGEIAALLEGSGFSWTRRTLPPADKDRDVDCILLDTIGELQALYPFATIVFVGGSIAPIGGHNILEPAAVGRCIVIGPHTFNFQAIVRAFVAEGAILQLPIVADAQMSVELARTFIALLTDDLRRQQIGARAQALFARNRGATERTIDALEPLLSG